MTAKKRGSRQTTQTGRSASDSAEPSVRSRSGTERDDGSRSGSERSDRERAELREDAAGDDVSDDAVEFSATGRSSASTTGRRAKRAGSDPTTPVAVTLDQWLEYVRYLDQHGAPDVPAGIDPVQFVASGALKGMKSAAGVARVQSPPRGACLVKDPHTGQMYCLQTSGDNCKTLKGTFLGGACGG